MKLGLSLEYAGRVVDLPMDTVLSAEELGFDSVWVPEVWGSDAVSIASWILARTDSIRVGTAIMQMPARTPALAAMTAMTLSQLSGGRFIAGIGASGPQVVEGWHGVPYGKPLQRTREYIHIMRKIMAREVTQFDGEVYQLPYAGPDATGLGKPLKSILQADTEIPIYTASISPGGLRISAEQADGVIPVFLSAEKFEVLGTSLEEGFSLAGSDRGYHNFDVAPFVPAVLGDDLEACRKTVKAFLALYIGGMGARDKNFYYDYAKKLGYVSAAKEIQELYLTGRKKEAQSMVPDALVDEIALVGDEQRIRDQAEKWLALGESNRVSTMIFNIRQPELLPLLAEIFS
jgi:F420-dependent oxidoreductase-like protein